MSVNLQDQLQLIYLQVIAVGWSPLDISSVWTSCSIDSSARHSHDVSVQLKVYTPGAAKKIECPGYI